MEHIEPPANKCKSIHCYQSAWMAHWMGVSCSAAERVLNGFGDNEKNIHDINHHDGISQMEVAFNTSGLVNNFGETETRSFRAMNECVRTRNLRNARGRGKLALWNGKETDKIVVSTSRIDENLEDGKVHCCILSAGVAATGISSKECPTRPESIFKHTKEKVKPHPFFWNGTFAVSKPLEENFSGSTYDIVPLRFGHSDNNFESKKNEICFSNNHLPELGRKHRKHLRRFPSCCSSPELTKSEKLPHFYHSLTRLPHSIRDGKTMRICANIDSVVGLSEGHQKFSETTHRFLITKKTDVSFGKGKEIIKNFGLFTEFGGNSYHDLHRSSLFSNCGQGVKIHSLGSSIDSEGKENGDNVKASKVFWENESWEETDIMDMDLSGVRLSCSSKAIKMDSRFPQLRSSAGVEIERKHIDTKLPDVNLEFCALSTGGNAKDGQELGSSETQNLDMGLLLGHAEKTYNSISYPCSDNSLKQDLSGRCPKRLKFIASDSQGLVTHNTNFKDLQHKKIHELLKFTSLPAGDGSHGKEFIKSDKTATLKRECESSLVDSARHNRDLLLSQSWIRRWFNNQAGRVQKKTEPVIVCEPQSSKLAFEDFKKKQFPSIAAMALVGKTISGFRPCDLQRRASYAVWNT